MKETYSSTELEDILRKHQLEYERNRPVEGEYVHLTEKLDYYVKEGIGILLKKDRSEEKDTYSHAIIYGPPYKTTGFMDAVLARIAEHDNIGIGTGSAPKKASIARIPVHYFRQKADSPEDIINAVKIIQQADIAYKTAEKKHDMIISRLLPAGYNQ